jgi:hypothetical protein
MASLARTNTNKTWLHPQSPVPGDFTGKDSSKLSDSGVATGVNDAAPDESTTSDSDDLRSCFCRCGRQLCCNSAVDPDDLILRQEREHLLHLLQPLEEENCKIMAVDACLCPLGCKKPTSCCSACNHRGFTYGYCVWQLAVLFFCWLRDPPSVLSPPLPGGVLSSFDELRCTDHINMNDTDIELDWNYTPMYCPSVQQILRTSNYTKGAIGYPGAFKSMQALGWFSSLDYYLNGTSYNQSQIWRNSSDDTFVLIDYSLYRKLDD